MARKVTVTFEDNALEAIERLKNATGHNMATVLRDALGLYDWAYRQSLEGKGIALIEDGEATREILLPFILNNRSLVVR